MWWWGSSCGCGGKSLEWLKQLKPDAIPPRSEVKLSSSEFEHMILL